MLRREISARNYEATTKSYRNLGIGGANSGGIARRHKARCNRRHERYQVSRAFRVRRVRRSLSSSLDFRTQKNSV